MFDRLKKLKEIVLGVINGIKLLFIVCWNYIDSFKFINVGICINDIVDE